MFGLKNEEILTCLLLIVVGYFIAKMFSKRCNGFRVGGENDSEPKCNGKKKAECNRPNCVFGNDQCNDVCVDNDYCHNNGLCKINPYTNIKYCECGEDWLRPNCKESSIPSECLNGQNRKDQSCQTKLSDSCCPNLGGYCNDTMGHGYGVCTM